jgi:LDH2 family malate/lactate/ureidoglycolate dehydrogenase
MTVSRFQPVHVGDATVTGVNPIFQNQVLVEIPLTGSATDPSWVYCFFELSHQFGDHLLVIDRATFSTPVDEIEQRVDAVQRHVDAANARYEEIVIAPMRAAKELMEAQRAEGQRLIEEAKQRLEAAKKRKK